MKLPEAIHGQFRNARREQGLTQSELARVAGCRQSAISMFESGRNDALSRDMLTTLAAILHIDILPMQADDAPGPCLKFCPIADCPSNIPYAVEDQVCFRPSLVREPAATRGHCAACGEFLESACPTCATPVQEGAFCRHCGEAYVAPAVSVSAPADQWASARRAAIRELRTLSATLHREFATPNTVLDLQVQSNRKKRTMREG